MSAACKHFLPCECKPKKRKLRIVSDKKQLFLNAWKMFYPDIQQPQTELMFHPLRKWRFDAAFVNKKLAVEIEGAVFVANRGHSSGTGITRDIEKGNAATLLGWRVLRFTTQMLEKDPHGCCQKVMALLNS